MRSVEWTRQAEADSEAYLDWIAERDPEAAVRIRREIVEWTERLAAHPPIGHPSGWEDYLKHSHPRRSKFIIYKVFGDRIRIAAFRDSRRDNSNLNFEAD